ncbi:glycosyltransferase [Nostoc sp. 3335mG]|nr:glycosyltransferase [Nostoc sp. 3335mG]
MRPFDFARVGSESEEPTTIIGGLPVSLMGMEESARMLVRAALVAREADARPFYSTSANGQVIALASEDQAFKDLLLQADQIHADGMPMVRLSPYVARDEIKERVATTDLIHAVARLAQKAGVSFYFLGATAEINRRAVANMRADYPELVFAGARDGYFTLEDEQRVCAEIARLRPDILWIGLGVPKEQEFVARNIENLRGVGVIKTSGGLFDFLSGKNSRAPKWVQDIGMEWAYRSVLEPRRLLGRYVKTNPTALWHIIFHSK